MKNLTIVLFSALSIGANAQICFSLPVNFPAGINSGPWAVVSADFNGDGKADLASANTNSKTVGVALGNGIGAFGTATTYPLGSNTPNSLVSSDFNGDGKIDLALACPSTKNISILLGTGTGSFGTVSNFTITYRPWSVICEDFNGDGFTDLATANPNSNNISVLLGLGNGSFSAATNFSVGTQPYNLSSADFNGDGKKDIATANLGSNDVSVLLGAGTGNFNPTSTFSAGVGPTTIINADFNNDGNIDLVTGNVLLFLGQGNGNFSAGSNVISGSDAITCSDYNNDGKMDLCLVKNNVLYVLLGLGNGAFGTPVNLGPSSGTNSICSNDFNGDGKEDIVTTVNTNDFSVFINGQFLNVSGSQSICYGSSTALTASGADSYNWSANEGGDTTASVSVSPTSNITYTLIGSSAGCIDTAIIPISVKPLPTILMSSSIDTVCLGSHATLSASGGTSYVWSPSMGLSSSTGSVIVASPTVSLTYTVIGTGGNGCVDTSSYNLIVKSCIGISELNEISAVGIYPNPSSGVFKIKSGEGYLQAIDVYNVMGDKVLSRDKLQSSEETIDLCSQPNGVYHITINAGGKSINRKIVLQ